VNGARSEGLTTSPSTWNRGCGNPQHQEKGNKFEGSPLICKDRTEGEGGQQETEDLTLRLKTPKSCLKYDKIKGGRPYGGWGVMGSENGTKRRHRSEWYTTTNPGTQAHSRSYNQRLIFYRPATSTVPVLSHASPTGKLADAWQTKVSP